MIKKSEIPLRVLVGICDPKRVNEAHVQGYKEHLARGLARSSFVDCSYLAIELAAQLYPEKFSAAGIMRAFRAGQNYLEMFAQRFMQGQHKSFKVSYYNYVMKHRYGVRGKWTFRRAIQRYA